MCDIMTIREAVERAKAEQVPLSEYALRRWIRCGAIPVRKTGKKNFISYSRVMRYISCEDGQDNEPMVPAADGGIRRIDL